MYLTSYMFTSEHINETYFHAVNSLNPSLTTCLKLCKLQIYRSFCSLTSKNNTRTFLVAFYPKRKSMLAYLMVFKLKRRLINTSCCCLACKNISHTLSFPVRSLSTSVALYLTSFNIQIDHTYILCCNLSSKYFTGTFLLTFQPVSTFFVACLYFIAFNCIQRKKFLPLKSVKRKLQIATSFVALKNQQVSYFLSFNL